MTNLKIDGERLWGDLMETAAIGGDAERRHLPAHAHRPRPPGARLVQGTRRGARLHRDGRRHGQPCARAGRDRPTCRRSPWAATSIPSRPAASSTACSACWRPSRRCAPWCEPGYETFAPIEVVNWTNEEGSRFAPAMIASGVFAGVFDRDWAAAREDRAGTRFGDALEAIGYRGTEPCGARPLSAFFELHIEQGPILEAEAKDIGVVTGVQGMRWYEVDPDRARTACRHHPDGCAARCAELRGAHRRRGRDDRPHPWPAGGRDSRPFRGEAGFAQRDPGRGVLHRRPSPPRIAGPRRHGEAVDRRDRPRPARRSASASCSPRSGTSRRSASIPTASHACARRRKGLVLRPATSCRAPAMTPPTCRASRRPPWCSCRAGTASATTRSSFRAGSSVRQARRSCCKRCSTMTANWRSEPRPPADLTRTAAPANRTLPQWPRSPGS